RMETNLVRKQQIAAGIGTGYDALTPGRELFMFSGTPAQGHDVKDLENAIKEQVKIIQSEPVTDEELARVKAQVVASKVYEKDSIFYQAMSIGMLETIGLDWMVGEQYVDKIKAVTKEQIQTVANKYLVDDNLTVAVLDPQPIDNSKPHSRAMGSRH
ncbi:MAG: insulinase family protein, partial [Gammaproteobacteria bacterium]|nr:insulinase family protein [Gammaproteobacteria bacterium]